MDKLEMVQCVAHLTFVECAPRKGVNHDRETVAALAREVARLTLKLAVERKRARHES